MFTDGLTIPADTVLEADVCIVGAGAAGITIARELAPTRHRVCVLESGGFEPTADVADLNRGQVQPGHLPENHPYLSATRLRFFGGTTNHWVGVCGPLSAIDFEEREWIPNSGWPFPRAELDDFYRRAAGVVQIRPFGYDPARLARAIFQFDGDTPIETEVRHFSPPTRFGEVYRRELADAGNVQVVLNANAIDLRTNRAVRRLDRVVVATLGGPRFSVRARHFVLATGGIENARLLLHCTKDDPQGLGNRHDQVGRYFMDHVFRLNDPGLVTLAASPNALSLYERFDTDSFLGHLTWGRFTLRADAQRRHRVPHHGVGLGPIPAEARARIPALDAVAAAAAEVTRPVGDDATPPTPWYVGMLGLDLEMTPDPSNRVRLGDQRDELGMRRATLEWKLTDEDRAHALRFLDVFATELGRSLGGRANVRLKDDFDWSRFQYAAHHLGTTRMHRDEKRGVVDEQGRVHGLDNLFVAGSSVFPTSGVVNPTFTIVALALRLADRLRSRLDSGADR